MTMDELNRVLRAMREQFHGYTPRVEHVGGRTVTLRSVVSDTTPELVGALADEMVAALNAAGVDVIGHITGRSALMASAQVIEIDVAVEDFLPSPVAVDYDPQRDWGTTDRGHTLNTMWETMGGFVILELSDHSTTYVLPVRRTDSPQDKERAVRAQTALHYAAHDAQEASEAAVDAPIPQDTPLTAHLAQPDARILGPALFRSPPAVECYSQL